MNYRIITGYILFFVVSGLALWDVVAEKYGGDEATISKVITELCFNYPGIAFAAGILVGHLFFSQHFLAK